MSPTVAAELAAQAAFTGTRWHVGDTAYRVTAHGRVECVCGAKVYTEQIGNQQPAFPSRCWRCRRAIRVPKVAR